jgi:predicted amidohydrolase
MIRAAVLELTPTPPIMPQLAMQTMRQNLEEAKVLIAEVAAQGAGIVVLPEYGLITPFMRTREEARWVVEEIGEANGQLLCGEEGIAAELSCIARNYSIAIAANLGDLVRCKGEDEQCHKDGFYQYKANALFDSKGKLVLKYWKNHLFYEPYFDVPLGPITKPLVTTIEIPDRLGNSMLKVKVGMIICYDIMFEHPQKSIVSSGIDLLLFSSWWINTPPLMTALQIQESWSLANPQITLLAAGAGNSWRFSGSGIYSSGIPLASKWNGSYSFSLLSDIDIREKNFSVSKFFKEIPDLVNEAQFVPFELYSNEEFTIKVLKKERMMLSRNFFDMITSGKMTCTLKIKDLQVLTHPSDNSGNFIFWASDHSKFKTIESYSGCGITYCLEKIDVSKCISLNSIDSSHIGERFLGEPLQFSSMRLNAKVSSFDQSILKFPISSCSSGYSVHTMNYHPYFKCTNSTCSFVIQQHEPRQSIDLMNFAIFLRENDEV